MLVKKLLLISCFQFCAGVIHHLKDAEYGRMPPKYGLDKFDQCMSDEGGVYCVATMELYSDTPNNDLMTQIQEYSAHTYKHYNHSKIERGICMTRSCRRLLKSHQQYTEADIGDTLEECVNESIWNEYGLQTKLLKHECVNQNTEEMDIYDHLFSCLLFSLLLLNIAGTVCHFIFNTESHEKNHHTGITQYLMCFSIVQNWNGLVSSVPEESKLRSLKGLNGIKTFILCLFIIGHVFYLFYEFVENTHTLEKYYEYFWYQGVYNGLSTAQGMFCISGFLLVYNLLLESEKRDITWNMVPKIIWLRLWRLAPVNLVCVLFSATLLRHCGDGPLWKYYITHKSAGDCRRYWWTHLLFINNYFTDDKYCVVQNWQLAADVQLFVLGLCIFVGTKASHRVPVLSSVALLGTVTLGLHIWWNDLEAFSMLILENRYLLSNDFIVRKFTHNNLQGYMLGMITGHYVYKLQKGKVDFSKYKPILGPLWHCIIPFLACLIYSGSYFYADPEKSSLALRITYGITLVPLISIITSYAIFAVVFRFNDIYTRIYEWDGWLITGRLSYSISLIHIFFIMYLHGARTQLIHVSTINHAILYLGIGSLSFLVAIPYFLMVEAPFNKLAKVIVTQKMQQVKKVE